MTENVLYALMFGWIPILFIVLGMVIAIKGWKEIYRGAFKHKKVMARCVDIQQTKEESYTVYRPIYEYEDCGRLIRASKIDYEYSCNVAVGSIVPINVEKKHPDVVMGEQVHLASAIAQLVFGLMFAFGAMSFIIPVLMMLFWINF